MQNHIFAVFQETFREIVRQATEENSNFPIRRLRHVSVKKEKVQLGNKTGSNLIIIINNLMTIAPQHG